MNSEPKQIKITYSPYEQKLDKRGRLRFGVRYGDEHFRVEITKSNVNYYRRTRSFFGDGEESLNEWFTPELHALLREPEFLSYLGVAVRQHTHLLALREGGPIE